MFAENEIPVTKLKNGEKGIVLYIDGGQGAASRLHAMGVKEGKEITKVSGMFWRGPVTVQVGQTRVSVGHGMASKIMVRIQ